MRPLPARLHAAATQFLQPARLPIAHSTQPHTLSQSHKRRGEYQEPEAAALHRKLLRCFKGRLRRLTVVGCIGYPALAACRSLTHIELRHTAADADCCSLGASCCVQRLLERDWEEDPTLPEGLQALSVRAPYLDNLGALLDDAVDLSALTALELGHGVGDMDFDDMAEELAGLTSLHRLVLRAEVRDASAADRACATGHASG